MRVFADTYYFIALLSERDSDHKRALQWNSRPEVRELITTSWVLLELADSMNLPAERAVVADFIARVREAPNTRIVPATEELLWRGFALYRSREDKEWSLTDCISFIVMADEGLTDALTGDHHFTQAGFTALLRE